MAGARIGFPEPMMKTAEQEYPGEYWERVEGVIFDIQRYSLHDGPGLRTCVFFNSALFVTLDRATQDDIINRTMHDLNGGERIGGYPE